MTVCVMIGNSDDRLTQRQWSDFYEKVDDIIERGSDTIYGRWHSLPNSPWQNACWSFVPRERWRGSVIPADALKKALISVAKKFDQETVAWLEGTTEMLETGLVLHA